MCIEDVFGTLAFIFCCDNCDKRAHFQIETMSEDITVLQPVGNWLLRNIFPGAAVSASLFPLEAYKKWRQSLGQTLAIKPKPWRGMPIFASNIVPTTAIQLLADHHIRPLVPPDSPAADLFASLTCGMLGATFAVIVENTVARQQKMESGAIAAFKDMIRAGGIRRMLKSYPLIAARDGLFTICLFTVNPALTRWAKHAFPDRSVSPFVTCAPLAVTGALLTHPFDTLATRMQLHHNPMTVRQAFTDVLKSSGSWRGLYLGASYRIGLFYGFLTLIPKAREYAGERWTA